MFASFVVSLIIVPVIYASKLLTSHTLHLIDPYFVKKDITRIYK